MLSSNNRLSEYFFHSVDNDVFVHWRIVKVSTHEC